jgi:hypothetical protein
LAGLASTPCWSDWTLIRDLGRRRRTLFSSSSASLSVPFSLSWRYVDPQGVSCGTLP